MRFNVAFVLLIAAMTSGCITQKARTLDSSVSERIDSQRANAVAKCNNVTYQLIDSRQTDSAGIVIGINAKMEDPDALLKQQLQKSGLTSSDNGNVDLQIEIMKIYLSTLYEAKSINVVVRVRQKGADDKLLRVSQTNVNWNSTENEYARAVARALDEVTKQIVEIANNKCK
jgi:hypothetical protein